MNSEFYIINLLRSRNLLDSIDVQRKRRERILNSYLVNDYIESQSDGNAHFSANDLALLTIEITHNGEYRECCIMAILVFEHWLLTVNRDHHIVTPDKYDNCVFAILNILDSYSNKSRRSYASKAISCAIRNLKYAMVIFLIGSLINWSFSFKDWGFFSLLIFSFLILSLLGDAYNVFKDFKNRIYQFESPK